ncbi:MAG: bifunctional diaminohydroxyphosphoribosylaminopyrimidine deaminase/5-amino-6-(5-phosphoribosylamino)uracil reductase RibD [Gammaproteobacteria bacterium]
MDNFFLKQALDLAKLRRGFTSPNPSVGAILVNREGQIIGSGYHQGPGSPHAEIIALQSLTESPENSTLYVTLEPCCHIGRTPPCTDAIVNANIGRVVYGYRDPNPIVSGEGAALLTTAEIRCEHIMLPEINLFYQSYDYWQRTHKPFITAKLAMSLDGKIAGEAGERKQITGRELQIFTHQMRKTSDAILTTAKTIIQDNPQLNIRLENTVIAKPLYILDRQLTCPLDAAIFTTAQSITVFHAVHADQEKREQLQAQGARCVVIDETPEGLNLIPIIEHIGNDGAHDLWVETGGKCLASFLKNNALQKLLLYIAPVWFGRGQSAFKPGFSIDLTDFSGSWQQIGPDSVLEIDF